MRQQIEIVALIGIVSVKIMGRTAVTLQPSKSTSALFGALMLLPKVNTTTSLISCLAHLPAQRRMIEETQSTRSQRYPKGMSVLLQKTDAAETLWQGHCHILSGLRPYWSSGGQVQ